MATPDIGAVVVLIDMLQKIGVIQPSVAFEFAFVGRAGPMRSHGNPEIWRPIP